MCHQVAKQCQIDACDISNAGVKTPDGKGLSAASHVAELDTEVLALRDALGF